MDSVSVNVNITKTDLYLRLKEKEKKMMKFAKNKSPEKDVEVINTQDKMREMEDEMQKKKIPFDMLFTSYIFMNNTNF